MAVTLPDFSGQCVGHYQIVSPLSSGSTCAVYRAVDTDRPGEFAVKCIPKFGLTPRQLVRRTSEVFHHQLVTGCSPHVLPLQEIVDDDHYLFLVTKLYEGDLGQAVWEYRLYQRNDALVRETFVDILDGIYSCHTKGVFHRDLKPDNILCNLDGSGIQIADFGLATRTRICRGSSCGTSNYMSPEQLTRDPIVYFPSLADIWSLGIILINLVTGHRPWRVASADNTHFRAFLDDEDYLYKTLPISPSLNRVLKWILCPNPMYRPQILQIRQAVLSVDAFYQAPRSIESAALAWSRRMALIQVNQTPDSDHANSEDLRDQSEVESSLMYRRTWNDGVKECQRCEC